MTVSARVRRWLPLRSGDLLEAVPAGSWVADHSLERGEHRAVGAFGAAVFAANGLFVLGSPAGVRPTSK